jgi:hypothetical protein
MGQTTPKSQSKSDVIFDRLKGAKSGISFALRRGFIKRTFVAGFWAMV